MRERGDQRLRRGLPVALRLLCGLVALLATLALPTRASAGPPPIPPGQEDTILELVEPIELGDRLFAAHTLHSMTIEGSTIVFWIAPPELDDPKDGSQYGQVRLHHPHFAPKQAKQIQGFAISTVQPGESGASVQKVAERIEANADGSFWGFENPETDAMALPAPEGPWRVYVLGLVVLVAFGLAVREHDSPWPAAIVVALAAAAVMLGSAAPCEGSSILNRALHTPPDHRAGVAGGVAVLGAVSTWMLALRLGLESWAAFASAMALSMSPWFVALAGADAAAPMAACLLAVAFTLVLEAACCRRIGAAVVLGCVGLGALALALRDSHALMVAIVLVPLLRRLEEGESGQVRWLLALGLAVAVFAGLPPYVQSGVALRDVISGAAGLVAPATGHPLAAILALVGLAAPRRSETFTGLRWVLVAWLVLAVSTGSTAMAAIPWALLAGRGVGALVETRPRLKRGSAIVVAAGALLAGFVYGERGETPQTERCT